MHPFAPGRYDVAISRFGDNVGLRPGSGLQQHRAGTARERLWLVWQSPRRNEWAMAIDAALNGPARPSTPEMAEDAFSLADRTATARLLESAGFGGVRFTEVRAPLVLRTRPRRSD